MFVLVAVAVMLSIIFPTEKIFDETPAVRTITVESARAGRARAAIDKARSRILFMLVFLVKKWIKQWHY